MNNWVSVKNRLPDKEGEYVVATKLIDDLVSYEVVSFGEIGKGSKRRFGFYVRDWDRGVDKREEYPDAWMEFEPYKEEKQR